MSIFFIFIMAAITRSDFSGSLPPIHLSNDSGTICQDNPYLSLSHPQTLGVPPRERLSQNSSISSWFLHRTISEIASVNLNSGPPFRARNSWPLSSKSTVITAPAGLPEAADADG